MVVTLFWRFVPVLAMVNFEIFAMEVRQVAIPGFDGFKPAGLGDCRSANRNAIKVTPK